MPIQLLHLWFAVIYGLVYSLFTLFYYLAGGTNHDGNPYIYSVIDWRSAGWAVLYCFIVIFIAMPVVHLVCFIIHFLKVWISRSCRCCHRNRGSDQWQHESTEMEYGSTSTSPGSSTPKLY